VLGFRVIISELTGTVNLTGVHYRHEQVPWWSPVWIICETCIQ